MLDIPHGMLKLRSMSTATVRGWLLVNPSWAWHRHEACGDPGRPRWHIARAHSYGFHTSRAVRFKEFIPQCKQSWGDVLEPLVEHANRLDEYLDALSDEQKSAVWDDHKTVSGLGGVRRISFFGENSEWKFVFY